MLTVTGGVGGLLGNAHILPGLLGCTLLGEAHPDTRHTTCDGLQRRSRDCWGRVASLNGFAGGERSHGVGRG